MNYHGGSVGMRKHRQAFGKAPRYGHEAMAAYLNAQGRPSRPLDRVESVAEVGGRPKRRRKTFVEPADATSATPESAVPGSLQ